MCHQIQLEEIDRTTHLLSQFLLFRRHVSAAGGTFTGQLSPGNSEYRRF